MDEGGVCLVGYCMSVEGFVGIGRVVKKGIFGGVNV